MIGFAHKIFHSKITIFLFTLLFSLSCLALPNDPSTLIEMEKNLPSGAVKPFVTSPVEEQDIPRALNFVTNNLEKGSLFLSFSSENPSEEELRRIQISESEARAKGLQVVRIKVPTKEAVAQIESVTMESTLNEVKSYFGKSEVDLEKKPIDISKMPTPVEKRLAIFYPMKSAIIKPIA